MRIAISGSSGFLGRHLKRKFNSLGWSFTALTRESFLLKEDEFVSSCLDQHDVVVNLVGSPLIGKWTKKFKQEIFQSRINTTRKIAQGIRHAKNPPTTWINISAVGIYHDLYKHTEASTGYVANFLKDLITSWEDEALKATDVTRVILLRTGIVLAKNEGALEKMAPLFRKGIGGYIGNGEQGVSWIHIDDFTNALVFIIEHDSIQGVVHAVSEYPTDNYHFSESIGKAFGQPVYFRIPKFIIRAVYGEGALILTTGQKVVPEKLLKNGFNFGFPTVDKALMDLFHE